MASKPNYELRVLREIASLVVCERNVRLLLEKAIAILERGMGVLRGTFTLLEGDELRIEATSETLSDEERALGRYKLGEGITGMVAKTGRSEVIPDVRLERRFLNRTRARSEGEALSFVCVPLVHQGEVIGTLAVDRPIKKEAGALAKDVALLEVVASIIAEAAHVYRESKLESEKLAEENRLLRARLDEGPGRLIGTCPQLRAVYEQIVQVAPSDATVLIRGGSGTGKELVAKAIQARSSRKDRPFVILNCAALPEALVESELFGHEKGAFTDARERRIGRAEAADGGTLFLDEIGDLSPAVQVKLLRFLQERTFSRIGSNEVLKSDVRFIAATSRNLEDLMHRGLFREDLYYRLSVFPIVMPALADRGSDVILLAEHFLKIMGEKYGKDVRHFSTPALSVLRTYCWPGNVRELENAIERAVLTTRDDTIHAYNLPEQIQGDEFAEDPFRPDRPMRLDEQVAAFERRVLQAALKRYGGNCSAAGRELGVSPRMMNYRLKKAGLLKGDKLS